MSALPRPDVTGPARVLNDALHDLHHHAGWPSLRTLAKETGVSHTTVSKAFSQPALPTWGTLELLVEAMRGDTSRFHELWLTASTPTNGDGPPVARIAGRRTELDVVRRHLETGTGLLLVTGEAGIGKTRLVEVAGADTQNLVAVGHCLPLSTEVPLLPVADCLRSIHDSDDGEVLSAAIASCPPYVAASLTPLLPEAARWAQPGSQGRRDDRQLLFSAVAAILRALTQQHPTALVVEDLHWADPATLDLLEHLLGRSLPVAIVGTWRSHDDATRTSAMEWLARVRRLPDTTTTALGPLTADETAEQLRLLGIPLPHGRDIHARSLGQPLFTEQLAAHDPDGSGLPELLADLLDSRLAGVPEESWAVLRLLGVAARPLTPALLADVTRMLPGPLTAELRRLQDRRLVRSVGDSVDLQHPLLADAVQRRLVPGEDLAAHRALAEALGSHPGAEAGEVAEHWRRAGDEDNEIRWRFAAADAAWARLDRRTEADHCVRIIEIWPRPQDPVGEPPTTLSEVYVRAMDALRFSFRYDEAARLSEVAEGHVEPVDDGVRADLLFRKAIHRGDAEGLDVGLELIEQALALCAGIPVRETTLRALDRKQSLLAAAGRYDEARAVVATQVEAARELGDEEMLGDTLMRQAWYAGVVGDPGAVERMAVAAKSAAATGNPLPEIRRGVYSTDVLLACGAPADAVLAAGLPALDVAREHEIDNPPVMLVRVNLASALLRGGRVAEAAALVDTSPTAPLDVDRWPLHASAASIQCRRGHPQDAHERFEAVFAALPESAGLDLELLAESGDAACWATDLSRSRRRLLAALDELAATVPVRPTAPVFVVAARTIADAEARHDGGTLDTLARLAGLLDDHADDLNLTAHRAAFEAELARLGGTGMVDHWTRTARCWDRLDRPHDAAYCRWRAAQAALRDGHGTVAARLLKRAAGGAREHVPLSRAIAETARA
jgi:hypothetical protein